jgi:hypothetical protein
MAIAATVVGALLIATLNRLALSLVFAGLSDWQPAGRATI